MKTSSSNGLPRPEEFPLGSMESRAAARAMLDRRNRVDLRIIMDVPRPHGDEGKSYRYHDSDGKIVEVVIPNSSLEESVTRGVYVEAPRRSPPDRRILR